MKKFIKTILSLSLVAVLVLSLCSFTTKETAEEYYGKKSEEANKNNYMFYDDFSSQLPGSVPGGFSASTAGGKIITEKTETPSGFKNVVVMDDTADTGGPSIAFNFEPTRKIYFKTRFKYNSTHSGEGSMFFHIRKDGYDFTRILFAKYKYYVNPNMKYIASSLPNFAVDGMWYTYEIYFDLDQGTLDFRIESDVLKNYPGSNAESIKYDKVNGVLVGKNLSIDEGKFSADDFINNITLATSSRTGTYTFDYFIVDNNHGPVQDLPKVKIPAPTTETPVERPVPGELNISANGRIIYFANKAYAENGVTYADGKKLLSELGFDVKYDKASGVLTAHKNGKTTEFVSGKGGAVAKKNTLYIPVRAAAESLGYEVGWDSTQNIVTIGGGKND